MEIVSQHTKEIMEECKVRAKDAGLRFEGETLEFIVTNQDLLELTPKVMIPTLYDYWVHDLELIKGKKEYELYPHNAYETVINSRPALSFYNDNNPDWLNVMIFYHVLAHVDFMQNNNYYRHTWDDDFVGQALADKRLINTLRTKHGRWVDYVIEFTRSIDNITGYYKELSERHLPEKKRKNRKVDFFFDVFLQQIKRVSDPEYLKELERYNSFVREGKQHANSSFISSVKTHYPEFEATYEKHMSELKPKAKDVIQFIMTNSTFLNQDENEWMKSVMEVVRNTALHFEPQRRTKIMNEGWATYWHQKLFLADDRIQGHEVEFAKINALVASVPKVGFNPYAIGVRLFEYAEDMAEKGKLTYEFEKLHDANKRERYNKHTGNGQSYLFYLRDNMCDFNFVNKFVDQDFVDRYKLVVIGERINQQRMTREYYIKSKRAEVYKAKIMDGMIHPPHITVDESQTTRERLCLTHEFEGKRLIPEFIENVMIGLEYLWGGEVRLATWTTKKGAPHPIVYSVKDRKVTRNDGSK